MSTAPQLTYQLEVSSLVDQIREAHYVRQAITRETTSLTNKVKAIYRHYLEEVDRAASGNTVMSAYVPDPEKKRMVSPYASLSEKELLALIAERLGPARALQAEQVVSCFKDLRSAAELARKPYERMMEKLAQQLPVWEWAESVRGFGAVGLAMIVAETSRAPGYSLSDYATHFRVWARMGLAVLPDGTRQRKIAGLSGEEAYSIGYNAQRRAIMFVIGDALIKGNQDGKYRTVYLDRKVYELERLGEMKGAAMLAHRRAQRYMEKRLLRDLWLAWRASA